MKLSEIRKRTFYNPKAKPSYKNALRLWLCSRIEEYPIALTLTLKQTIIEKTPNGTVYRSITKQDCERITQRFQQKLNFAVFGNAAKRYGKTLKYLPVVEGERSGKALHLHFAIGNLPKHIKFNQLNALVCKAKKFVEHIDEHYKVDIADSGWLEYITKETATKHSDNVLWTHIK